MRRDGSNDRFWMKWAINERLREALGKILRQSVRCRMSPIGWAGIAGAASGYPIACGVSILSLGSALAPLVGSGTLTTQLGYGVMTGGAMIGAIAFVPWCSKYPPHLVIALSVSACGVLVACVPWSGNAFLIVALLAGGGVGISADFGPVWVERLNRRAPGAKRARGPAFVAVQALPFPVGLLAQWLDVFWALGLLGAVGVLLAVAMLCAPPIPPGPGETDVRWGPTAVAFFWKNMPVALCVQVITAAMLMSIVVGVIPPLAVRAGLDTGWIGALSLTVLGAAFIYPRLQQLGPMWPCWAGLIGALLLWPATSLGGHVVPRGIFDQLSTMLAHFTGVSPSAVVVGIMLFIGRLLAQAGMNAIFVSAQDTRGGEARGQAIVQAKIRLLWVFGATVGLVTGPFTVQFGIVLMMAIASAIALIAIVATRAVH